MQKASDALDNIGQPSECRWRWVLGVNQNASAWDQLFNCLNGIYELYKNGVHTDEALFELIDNLESSQVIDLANFWNSEIRIGCQALTKYKT